MAEQDDKPDGPDMDGSPHGANDGPLEQLRELRIATEGHFGILLRQERGLANVQKDLKALVQSLAERSELDVALKEALAHSAALERLIALLEQQKHEELKDALALSVALERQVTELEREKDAARDEAERQGELVHIAEKEFRALERDHKSVKRKYRSTLEILDTERAKLKDFKARLAQANAVVAGYDQSLPWRAYRRLLRIHARLRKLVGRLTGSQGRKRTVALLDQSPLFDRKWYLRNYPDVAATGVDPVRHFLELGWREGRDPSPAFSTTAYLKANSDVARAGINPLVHFIQFGCSEGRGAPAHRSAWLPAESPVTAFGPAAPCVLVPLAESAPVSWVKSADLEVHDRLLLVDEMPIGHATDGIAQDVRREFQLLRLLSGYGACVRTDTFEREDHNSGVNRMIDAWYAKDVSLRTRWKTDQGAIVVRAYQHDPTSEGRLALVGEGPAQSPLDTVDVALSNPYFPLLFLFSGEYGSILGSSLLAFPSLCRGGLHYPELIALSTKDGESAPSPFEVARSADALARQVLDLRSGVAQAAVAVVEVDLAGADGTHPLFQSDFRAWLERVFFVGVQGKEQSHGSRRADYLLQTVKLDAGAERTKADGVLGISADMIPSISALVAPTHPAGGARRSSLPVIVAPMDDSQPSTLISLGDASSPLLAADPQDYPTAWPRFASNSGSALPAGLRAAAIRLLGPRDLGDAELLIPVMEGLPSSDGREAITWIVYPGAWEDETLAQSLEALSLQLGSSDDRIAIVGSSGRTALGLAERFFPSKVRLWPDAETAIRNTETPLSGYLGPGVLLHDGRTAQTLASMLRDRSVASAGCVVVLAEKRGRGWQVAPADSGEFANGHSFQARAIWRAKFPVSLPPRDLWLARTSSVTTWLKSDGALEKEDGAHLCTSFVTASYVGVRSEEQAPIRVPRARDDASTRVEALYG